MDAPSIFLRSFAKVHASLIFFSFLCSITVLSVGLVDFVVSIIQRYSGGGNGSIGYSAHIAGGTAGILIGMNVLQNFHHKVHTRGYQISGHFKKLKWCLAKHKSFLYQDSLMGFLIGVPYLGSLSGFIWVS